MSWNCPYCDRKYPDSTIGIPMIESADEKTHCAVCAVDPNEIRELVEEWSEFAGTDFVSKQASGYREAHGDLANELEELLGGSDE